jgi:hypothetical protein
LFLDVDVDVDVVEAKNVMSELLLTKEIEYQSDKWNESLQ